MIFSSALSILLVALYNFIQMSKTISELKETNKSLEVIFDNAYDIIMTIERGSIYTRINKGGMGTHDVKAIPGKSIFELLPKERAQYYADLNEQAFITGKIVHVTDWYDTDGTTTWHHLTLCPVLDEMGNVTKLIGFSRDITEEKNLLRELTKNKELAEAANQAKSAFLANMSHEIRTPMAAVLGFVDILEREDLSSEKKQNTLEAVRRNGTYLMNLLGEILDLTKIEAGQIDMHVTAVNLKEEITSVVELLRARAEKKQLALNVICSVNAASINTDPLRFRQILVNVISNAIKFTTKGSVDVSATVDGKLIRIDIRDTGMGIPERNQTEIFSPFSQGDADISGKFGGTGLGLAISSRLAAALGGKLQLTESAPGSGSVFSIWIDPSLAAPSNKDSRRKNLPPKSLKDLKVLTVEDNADVQDMLFDILSYEGAQVFRASNGKQALEKIGSENFNVVLMDVQMPEMNGYVATERLRQNGCLIPIIALTAFASVESTKRCMNAGFSGVLYKPFAKDELIEAILRHSKAPATNV